jgi:hypothetical protein
MRVKVLSMFFGVCPYEELFLKNIREYCNKWEYEFIYDRRDDGADHPYKDENWFWWHNHTMITEHIDSCDYIMWIDTDCIVLNMNIPITKIIRGYDMVVTKQENVETGSFIVKCSEWTKKFLKDWKAYGDKRINYIYHPAQCNNYICLLKLLEWYDFKGKIRFMKDYDYMIKHVYIFRRTKDTFIMHVPGSPFEDKVFYMEQHSKEITR